MLRRYYSPFREFERLQHEMNRLFDTSRESVFRRAPGYPAMNIWVDDDDAILTAELPGIDPNDVDISVAGETLTLSGKYKPDDLPEDAKVHRQERTYGSFSRSFQLPFLVDAGKVEASYARGILEIKLPRAEADKPKKIAVKAA
jgi:HSP20 family protein